MVNEPLPANLLPIVDANTVLKGDSVEGNVLTNDNSVHPIKVTGIDGSDITPTGSTVTTDNGGTLTIDSTGEYTYTPAAGFEGKDTVKYTVCSDINPAICKDELLLINVEAPLDPTDLASNSIIGNPDEMLSYGDTAKINVTGNDFDPEGDDLDFKGVLDPATGLPVIGGTITLNSVPGTDEDGNPLLDVGDIIVSPDGTVAFIPKQGFKGTANLEYEICDDGSPIACTIETILITVLDTAGSLASMVDLPPYANDDFAATDKNIPVSGMFANNDSDPDDIGALQVNGVLIDPLATKTAVQTLATSEGGTMVLNSDGSYDYTPPVDFVGTDNVVYEICDTSVEIECTKATIAILVNPIVRDYSDLPAAWGVRYSRYLEGANNTASGIKPFWLGDKVTSELEATVSSTVFVDAGDDGLIIPAQLDSTKANTYKVIVNSDQSGVKVYFKLYIDWDNDGTFEDAYTGDGTTGSPDTVDVSVNLPSGFMEGTVNYRLVAQLDPATLDAEVMDGGEIEGYQVVAVLPVPVKLISLSAKLQGADDVLVEWSTATEINNDRFDVQRRYEFESEYTTIGEVKGMGTTNSTTEYLFVDNTNSWLSPVVYYRLGQVDYDGKYTTTYSVPVAKDADVEVVIYPNPLQNKTIIAVLGDETVTDISIHDVRGRLVTDQTIISGKNGIYSLDMGAMRNGIYFVKVGTKTNQITQKIMVTR